MIKFFNFLKNILFGICVLLALFFAFNELYFLDRVAFVSPLAKDIELVIRDDSYGNGHFGARRKGGLKHRGIDFSASVGTPVCAARSGWVIGARTSRSLGKYVEIYHKGGFISLYGHLDSIEVNMLERVRQGEVIGSVGKTGNANYKGMKAHLHFSLMKDNKFQDPVQFLPSF
ncbi:MAG: M23 family metallopeptidase [Candidatus Omnitrophica bacterium]|nr:M23 family metallopeptidase [Candidatus Omnitrophota bacterium]